ncbi:ABC transporter ATP-binding protein [Erwinia billingiae]|uniref:ABC transporter ATP-binding protein n=1 Tax=Erwinia billingiae TaxID=182337 RepID=UPI0032080DD9
MKPVSSPRVVLSVKDLHISFRVGQRSLFSKGKPQRLQAVRGISFDIRQGETFSLVGESGCGKSTVARALAGLYQPEAGEIAFAGQTLDPQAAPSASGIQMIFQDPYASLNPRWRIERIIAEPLCLQKRVGHYRQARQQCIALLEQVGLTAADMEKYPHQFSGGQRQRISIARALATQPRFLICDEPTSALDVSVQAQVLNLMRKLQRELGLTYFFISHNMSVISHFSDRVGVMYLGRIVETGTVEEIFSHPAHPYTRLLMAAIPNLEGNTRERSALTGEVPSPLNPPSGCSFHPRCPHATAKCRSEAPVIHSRSASHQVECHFPELALPPQQSLITGAATL